MDPQPIADSERTVAESEIELAEADQIEMRFEMVGMGFEQPLYITGADDGTDRLFVVEKTGRIWTLNEGERAARPWLDLSGFVSTRSEQGLLGLAFAPDYAESGVFYVNFTDKNGETVIGRIEMEPRSEGPAPGAPVPILSIPQPYANHNGGMIEFGPDGHLYIGMGDGGSGGDPENNGQDRGTLLGSMLRIRPLSPDDYPEQPYAIPQDNPAVSVDKGDPWYPQVWLGEIWSWGLRNPWRFSFDRETGDLWIGDVGQNAWEEIHHIAAGDIPGRGYNFGWNVLEGTHPYPAGSDPGDTSAFAEPFAEYGHDAGNSVTGGYVYRGSEYPEFNGMYLFGDFGSGRVWATRPADATGEVLEVANTGYAISSFGEDDDGELYLVDFNGGEVYRIHFK